MKKTYIKPRLAAERLNVHAPVGAACGMINVSSADDIGNLINPNNKPVVTQSDGWTCLMYGVTGPGDFSFLDSAVYGNSVCSGDHPSENQPEWVTDFLEANDGLVYSANCYQIPAAPWAVFES